MLNLELEGKEYYSPPSDLDIFVPDAGLDAYFEKHHIFARRFPQGQLSITGYAPYQDQNHAFFQLLFKKGSKSEPSGQTGITHLVEHLISNGPGMLSDRCDAGYNARTSPGHVTIEATGAFSSKYRDYGIKPLTEGISQQLRVLELPKERLHTEKEVVRQEICRDAADYRTQMARASYRTIFSTHSPINYPGLGLEDGIRRLTMEDATARYDEMFIARDTEFILFYRGNLNQYRKLAGDLMSFPKSFPAREGNPDPEQYNYAGRLSPDFVPGKLLHAETASSNDMASIWFLWETDMVPYTPDYFAKTAFFEALSREFFTSARNTGLAYDTNLLNIMLDPSGRLMGLEMLTSKRSNMDGFSRKLSASVKNLISSAFAGNFRDFLAWLHHKRTLVIPVSAESRFQGVVTGLREYGRAVDDDKLIPNRQISAERLRTVAEYFQDIPAVIVIA